MRNVTVRSKEAASTARSLQHLQVDYVQTKNYVIAHFNFPFFSKFKTHNALVEYVPKALDSNQQIFPPKKKPNHLVQLIKLFCYFSTQELIKLKSGGGGFD